MVEAERELRLGDRDEGLLLGVPRGGDAAGSHTKQECLFRKRNRCGHGEAEDAVIRDRGDRATRVRTGEAARTGQLDEPVVTLDEIGQRKLFGMTDHRDKNPVLGLHGEADIDRSGMDQAVADEPSRSGRHLGKPHGKSAKGIEGGTRLHRLPFTMRQQGVQLNRQDHGGERTRPTAPHRVGDSHAHRGSGGNRVALQVLQEAFQIVDRDAPSGSASGDSGEISGMEPEFGHPRLHARGEEAGPTRMGGNGKAADRGLDGLLLGFGRITRGSAGSLAPLRLLDRWRGCVVEAESLGILVADFQVTEGGSHRVALACHGREFVENAAAGSGDSHHGLVGLHLEEVGVGLHAVSDGESRAHDGRLGDGLAELRHDDREEILGIG